MRIGFLGTGAIAEAIVVGLFRHGAYGEEVLVSRRSAFRSERLAKQFSLVRVVDDPQELVDSVDWIFFAVLPEQAEGVLLPLRFREDQTLISMVAGLSVEQMREVAAPITRAHRIIPMPPIELGVGPVPIYPYSEEIASFFAPVGTPIRVDHEEQIATLSTGSSVMAAFFEVEATVASWMAEHGFEREASAAYTAALLRALATSCTGASADELAAMSDECCTKGGLNEQVLRESRELGWFADLRARLDGIWSRLQSNG